MTKLVWGVVPPYLDTNIVKQVWVRLTILTIQLNNFSIGPLKTQSSSFKWKMDEITGAERL